MFGINIFDASLFPAMLVALAAGILSFLSPCVLPIVPPYLAYMSGISVGQMRQGRAPMVAKSDAQVRASAYVTLAQRAGCRHRQLAP